MVEELYNLNMFYVYILKNKFGDLYTGMTKDIDRRIYTHNSGRGARFTKRDTEFKLVFSETYESITEARKREIQIKKWRREKKEMLINRFANNLETKTKSG